MIYDENKIRIYLEGEKAYKNNGDKATCPYVSDSIESNLWLQGYNGVRRIVEAYRNPQYSEMEKT